MKTPLITYREAGVRDGKSFADCNAGARALRMRTSAEVAGFVGRISAKLKATELRLALANKTTERLHDMAIAAKGIREAAALRRAQHPEDYDWLKGLLYLGIAVALFVADLAILGRTFALLLDEQWKAQNGLSLVDELPKSFLDAISHHFAIAALSGSVLLLGLAVKVLRDAQFSGPPGDEHTVLRSWNRRIAWVMAILSVVVIGVTAWTRYASAATTASSQNKFSAEAAWLSFVIGIGAPLIGAGFFMRGYDALFARIGLIRAVCISEWWNYRHRRSAALSVKLAEQFALQDMRLQRIASSGHASEKAELRVAEYLEGYRDGALALLRSSDGKSLYEVLKPVYIQRMLEGNDR